MNWLIKACRSTIGKKIVMAITGLALCGFLVVHLAGNLLLYVGAEQYNHYAHSLHAQQTLIYVAEVGLLVMFLGHIFLAVVTTSENNDARPVGYAMKQSKIENQGPLAAPAASVMYGTGIVVLLFLLLHLSDFRFTLRHSSEVADLEPFAKAQFVLRDPLSAIVYVVGSVVLGYHVLHGFQSAFQSLGLNHPKYTPLIKKLSLLFAIIVGVGFASFPIWAFGVK